MGQSIQECHNVPMFILDKEFKNGPSKTCGRQPLKYSTWSILKYLDPHNLCRNHEKYMWRSLCSWKVAAKSLMRNLNAITMQIVCTDFLWLWSNYLLSFSVPRRTIFRTPPLNGCFWFHEKNEVIYP